VALEQRRGHVEGAVRRAIEEIEHEAKATIEGARSRMSRSLGPNLPETLLALLSGTSLAERVGLTFVLITDDEQRWPHVALLSVGELVCMDDHTLRAALWPNSTATANLTREGRGLLACVADGAGYYIRCGARRLDDLGLGDEGQRAAFELPIEDVLEDAVAYATLTSGITFELTEPGSVVARWERTLQALRR